MISLPSILKRLMNPKTTPYDFPEAENLLPEVPAAPPSGPEASDSPEGSTTPPDFTKLPKETPLDYAKLQAEAIMEAARQEAAEMLDRAKDAMEDELEQIRAGARDEGFRTGYTEGVTHAMAETQEQRKMQAAQLAGEVARFLDRADLAREELLQQTQNELRDLAIAIAEKIVRVSLKNSGEILSRMISRATEKMRRKEWVHIYIAGCDAKSFAQVSPSMSALLGAISDHVKIIPIAEEEPGTCMIETPDGIIDASVSTQFSNIRDLLSDSYVQNGDFQ